MSLCTPIILFGLTLGCVDGSPSLSQVAHSRHAVGAGQVVRASFYGGGPKRLEPNTHTASGERFNQWGMTAAHRSLPFGTRLLVCYRGCVKVRINDRGPAKWTGKSLDLSRGAAYAIGMRGSASVRISKLEQ